MYNTTYMQRYDEHIVEEFLDCARAADTSPGEYATEEFLRNKKVWQGVRKYMQKNYSIAAIAGILEGMVNERREAKGASKVVVSANALRRLVRRLAAEKQDAQLCRKLRIRLPSPGKLIGSAAESSGVKTDSGGVRREATETDDADGQYEASPSAPALPDTMLERAETPHDSHVTNPTCLQCGETHWDKCRWKDVVLFTCSHHTCDTYLDAKGERTIRCPECKGPTRSSKSGYHRCLRQNDPAETRCGGWTHANCAPGEPTRVTPKMACLEIVEHDVVVSSFLG